MILRKRVIGSLLMTRQYPDYDTPAHLRAREASASSLSWKTLRNSTLFRANDRDEKI